MNSLREKMNGESMIRGTLVSLCDPSLCEIMGNAGYNCVWIDTEHTYMSERDVLCHLNAARASGIASVVRLPQNDLTATKKILEMGPDGNAYDEDSGLPHQWHALWNLAAMIELEARKKLENSGGKSE